MTSCIIIGGGITGLVAGTQLQQRGIEVTILDKGRGIGGRMATRRVRHPKAGDGIFDYGLQYITARSPELQHHLNHWQAEGLVTPWDCAARKPEDINQPKYRGKQSNRAIAKHLAQHLNVHTATKAVRCTWEQSQWSVATEDGRCYQSDRLLLTTPVPQALQLLQDSQIALSESVLTSLRHVTYHPCLTVLAIVSSPIPVQTSGSMKGGGDVLAWLACNHHKGISPDCTAVTLQASAAFSARHAEPHQREAGAQALMAAAEDYFGGATVLDYHVHFWRYSTPKTCFEGPFLAASTMPAIGPLYLAGDAFRESDRLVASFEAAFLSGLAVAAAICQRSVNTKVFNDDIDAAPLAPPTL